MARQFSLAIVGADYPNKKGPGRRFEIAMCVPGEPVELLPEPKNPSDPQAIAVYSARGIQIGYVRAEQAQYLGTEMRRGGVSAIYQRQDVWGCTIRVGVGGTQPILPDPLQMRDSDWPPPGSEEPDWWPDPVYPDL